MKTQSKESNSKYIIKVSTDSEVEPKHTDNLEEWGQLPRAIILTNNQIIALESYIINSSYYRQSECSTSEQLLTVNHEDADLSISAKANIEYYQKLEKELETIIKALKN